MTKEEMRDWLISTSLSKAIHICTTNPEMTEWYLRDAEFRQAVDQADIRTVDGVGVAAAIWRQYGRMVPRFTGVELVKCLIRIAGDTKRKVTVVGATDASRTKFEEMLKRDGITVHRGVSPKVTDDGCVTQEERRFNIPDSTIVLVALGMPKQERWIQRQLVAKRENGCIYAGIGGVIDYLSGTVPFAPLFVRQLGLEWLFRLILEPRKRLRRQLTTLPQFLLRELLTLTSVR